MGAILLPNEQGELVEYDHQLDYPDLRLDPEIQPVRLVYAATHIVAQPSFIAEAHGGIATPAAVDWEATHAYREHLWSLGFGIAEAMDTAQRGMETGWDIAKILLQQTLQAARGDSNKKVIGGAGSDLVRDPTSCSMEDLIASYVAQVNFIQKNGGEAIIFPNTILPTRFPNESDYKKFIDGIMKDIDGGVYLHWLGKDFVPLMKAYWGHENLTQAGEVVLEIMNTHKSKIKGIKLSTLDEQFEIGLRRKIKQDGQIVLTGDDFNFPELIKGTSPADYSHALLGIFDAIAPVAAKALQYLARGDTANYEKLMKPTEPLSRHIFQNPTMFYKVALVWLAYLNGHQNHFSLVGGIEGKRSLFHLAETFRLADQAGLIEIPSKTYFEKVVPILRTRRGYNI